MRPLLTTKAFRRDYKRLSRSGYCDIEQLEFTIDNLLRRVPLPPSFREHPLIGEWLGCMECHVTPDCLLIYEQLDEGLKLYRLGSHAELFE